MVEYPNDTSSVGYGAQLVISEVSPVGTDGIDSGVCDNDWNRWIVRTQCVEKSAFRRVG